MTKIPTVTKTPIQQHDLLSSAELKKFSKNANQSIDYLGLETISVWEDCLLMY